MNTRGIRDAFYHVIAQGYESQVPEAYNHSQKLIHLNKLQVTLAGAIVLVYCTLEKALFSEQIG
jgi:hypothetical protein